MKSKLIILNISWFTPYFLIRISVEHRDFLHFFNSWNNKLLSLPTWKLSNKMKLNTQIYFFIHSYYHITWIYTSHFRTQNNVFYKSISVESVVNEEVLAKTNLNENSKMNFTSHNLPFLKCLTIVNLLFTYYHEKQKIIKK